MIEEWQQPGGYNQNEISRSTQPALDYGLNWQKVRVYMNILSVAVCAAMIGLSVIDFHDDVDMSDFDKITRTTRIACISYVRRLQRVGKFFKLTYLNMSQAAIAMSLDIVDLSIVCHRKRITNTSLISARGLIELFLWVGGGIATVLLTSSSATYSDHCRTSSYCADDTTLYIGRRLWALVAFAFILTQVL